MMAEGGRQMPNVEGKRVLFVVAPGNFRDEELFEPKAVLERAGVKTAIASRQAGTITGAGGGKASATIALQSADAANYDAIVFIGGPGASAYFNDSTAQQIAIDAVEQGKILAAICIAPSILANAGILEGKKATCFSGEAGNLQAKGANYTGQAVTVDGRIITANGPSAAKKFGEEILKSLQ